MTWGLVVDFGTLISRGRIAGPVLALLSGVVGLSAVQAHFALETKPIWDVGVLRYGYKNPGINQVLQNPLPGH